MNTIETFEQFLATNTAQFSAWVFILNLILTALLSYLLGLLYNRFGDSLSNRKAFAKNFVVLAVTTMIIITIVKSSLALSLGLVGALSIVRFRSAIKEPEELTYLFLNIAIGLGFGADQKLATILGFIFIALFIVGKKILYKKTTYENQNLIMTVTVLKPEKDFMGKIAKVVQQYTQKADLKRFDENDDSLVVSFIVEAEGFQDINDAKAELQDQFNNITVSLIDNNIII